MRWGSIRCVLNLDGQTARFYLTYIIQKSSIWDFYKWWCLLLSQTPFQRLTSTCFSSVCFLNSSASAEGQEEDLTILKSSTVACSFFPQVISHIPYKSAPSCFRNNLCRDREMQCERGGALPYDDCFLSLSRDFITDAEGCSPIISHLKILCVLERTLR